MSITLPSATVITGQIDPLRSEGKAYADKLAKAGVNVRYKNYDLLAHAEKKPKAATQVFGFFILLNTKPPVFANTCLGSDYGLFSIGGSR